MRFTFRAHSELWVGKWPEGEAEIRVRAVEKFRSGDRESRSNLCYSRSFQIPRRPTTRRALETTGPLRANHFFKTLMPTPTPIAHLRHHNFPTSSSYCNLRSVTREIGSSVPVVSSTLADQTSCVLVSTHPEKTSRKGDRKCASSRACKGTWSRNANRAGKRALDSKSFSDAVVEMLAKSCIASWFPRF